MARYYRVVEAHDAVLAWKAQAIEFMNRFKAIAVSHGAEDVVFFAGLSLSVGAFKFRPESAPDSALWKKVKRVKNGWLPRAHRKALKDLNKALRERAEGTAALAKCFGLEVFQGARYYLPGCRYSHIQDCYFISWSGDGEPEGCVRITDLEWEALEG